jgi:hypothetical protein
MRNDRKQEEIFRSKIQMLLRKKSSQEETFKERTISRMCYPARARVRNARNNTALA